MIFNLQLDNLKLLDVVVDAARLLLSDDSKVIDEEALHEWYGSHLRDLVDIIRVDCTNDLKELMNGEIKFYVKAKDFDAMRSILIKIKSIARYIFADKLQAIVGSYLTVLEIIAGQHRSIQVSSESMIKCSLASMQMMLRQVIGETIECVTVFEVREDTTTSDNGKQ